jgi:hypothetical protein
LYAQALELVPEDDAELRKSIVKKHAVATVTSFHVADVERDRRRQPPAVDG